MTARQLSWLIPLLAAASACQHPMKPERPELPALPVESVGNVGSVPEVTPVTMVVVESGVADEQLVAHLKKRFGALNQCHMAFELRPWALCPACEPCIPEGGQPDCTFPPPPPKRAFMVGRLAQCPAGVQGGVILHQGDAVAGAADGAQPPP